MASTEVEIEDYRMINNLQRFESKWQIVAQVMRRSNIDSYNNSKGAGTILKIILMDEEGTKIQAVVWNEDIQRLEGLLQIQKQYSITNGLVKGVNDAYTTVHEKMELSFNKYTEIVERARNFKFPSSFYKFTSFDDLLAQTEDDKAYDVIAFVINVKPRRTITKPSNSAKMILRDITLRDTKFQSIKFTLWGDLAENEGEKLSELTTTFPIVAVSEAKRSSYEGEYSLSSVSKTTIQIDPDIIQATELKEWLSTSSSSPHFNKFSSPHQKIINNAEPVSIRDIINGLPSTTENLFCSFVGMIMEVKNKETPWYDACNICNKKVTVQNGIATCLNCGSSNSNYTTRYLLQFVVQDEDERASVTLFEEAESFIGCNIPNFIASKDKGILHSDYVRKLYTCIGKIFKFYIKGKALKASDRKLARFVALKIEEEEEPSNPNKRQKQHI